MELLAVIVLLGILGITAFARMSGPAAYRPNVVANLLLGEFALAQQMALSRADATVTLQLTVDASAFTATTLLGGISQRSQSIDRDGVTLNVASGLTAGAVSAADPLVVTFSNAGDVDAITLGAASGDAGMGAALSVSGSRIAQLCLYPSGLTTDGACL